MDPLGELIGESPGIAALRETIARLLQRQSDTRRLPPILIQGETGTGKGLAARVIHGAGPRAGGPFIDVNCAAIPETLLEAEMFGFERGAFTDARQAKRGLFQAAHHGTIFLDEVGLLPEALQSKLLKVIEERAVRRLGSTRSEPVDVWVLTATSENLRAATRERRFREDLYHRLAVLTLWLPPLRERGRDIVVLAEHFLQRACADYGLPPKSFAADAEAALRAYAWPGNVRELANVMERVVLLSDATEVTAESLGLAVGPSAGATGKTSATLVPLDDAVGSVERAHLLEALRQTGWNISRAAARLGIPRNTLRYRIEKHGLQPDAPRGRRRRRPAAEVAPGPAELALPAPPASDTPAAGLRWERRRVTLLRAAVVVPGAPESTAELARAAEVLVEKVQSFGGHVEELSPAGLVAAFGLDPMEDAPMRAALCAVAIHKAAERARGRAVDGMAVRVAIHLGQFMLGRIGDTVRIDEDAKRAAWSVLGELIQRATADTVLVSGAAAPFLDRRVELAPVDTTGPEAMRVYRLAGREPSGLALARRVVPFVGRHHDLRLLESRLASVKLGHGQVVGIVGEAGIGKSRLLFEFRRGLADEPVHYLEGRCLAYASAVPYFPVLAILTQSCRIADSDSPETVERKVRGTLEELGVDAGEAAPYLLQLLDVPEALPDPNPETIKARTFEALQQLVLGQSRRAPLILVVDDLHWVDRTSEEYLAALVDLIPRAPVLVVTAYRPGYRPPWIDKSYATQIALRPLAPEDSLSVVRSVLGDRERADPYVDAILAKAEGNPFFLEELARAIREQSGLSPASAVPDTIEDVILARMDHLAPQPRRLLQCAAVVGKDVPYAILQAATDLPEESLRRDLLRLQAAEFLYETSPASERELTFKHALTHEVAYGSLLPEQRRGLHARLLEAMERLHADRLAEHVERLAHHAFHGEAWDRAVVYLRQAGAKAAGRSAHAEAVAYLAQALAALGHLAETRERLEQAVDVRFELRTSLLPLGELERILRYLQEAEALARRLEDQGRLGRLATYVTNYFFMTGDQERALDYGRRALGIAARLGDFALQAETHLRMGQVHHVLGDYRQAAEVLRRSVASLPDALTHERFGLPNLFSVGARNWLVRSLAELGEFADALTQGDEALRIAEAVDQPIDLIVAAQGLGFLYLRKGELPRAVAILERGLDLCREWKIPVWFPEIAAPLGLAYALGGRLTEAVPLLEQAVEKDAAMKRLGGHSLWVAWLSEGQLLAGRPEIALGLAERALALARAHRERGHEAWTLRVVGDLASRRAEDAAADEAYRRGLVIADELGMRPLTAHCHLGLGKLYGRTGDQAGAKEHLTTATTMYREMDMGFWLAQAEAALRS